MAGGLKPSLVRMGIALAIATFPYTGAAQAQGRALEQAVKATYLHKFMPYVEWPASAFETPTSPLTLCVVGHDPFGSLVEQAVGDQRVENRGVVVRRLGTVGRGSGCHIAFLAGSAQQPVADAVRAVEGAPVLTVVDRARTRGRAIIDFELKGGRVRFHINDEAAARNGLRINSKLLGLALTVQPRKRS